MRRDPTEFRQRFAAWKDGENYWDTRGEDILPGYSGGKTKKDSAYVSPQAQQAVRYFMSKGLTDFQAAGLVGNLMRESSMNHRTKNSGSGAYGLAQWLGPRKRALFNKYGNNPSFQNQLDFIWHELNTSHKNGLKYLKRSKTAEEAARNVMGYYEFSVGPEGAIAEMNKYGQDGRRSMREGVANASRLMGQPAPSRGPLKPVLISTQPIVERLKEKELPLQLPNQQPVVQVVPQSVNSFQQTQNTLAQSEVPVLGDDYWENYFNNNSLDQFQSLIQQQMTSHKHGKNILPRHADGKTPGEYNEELVELPEVRVDDATGDVVNNGRRGSVRLPEIVVNRTDPRNHRSAFDGNQEYLDDLVSFVPVAGDVNDAINAGIAANNEDYLQAGILGGGLLLPNVLEKPLRSGIKFFKNAWLDYKYLNAIKHKHIQTLKQLRDKHFIDSAPTSVYKKDNKPITLYHGTPTKGWNEYKDKFFGSNTDSGYYGKGLYLSENPNHASIYKEENGELKELYLNSNRPFYSGQLDVPFNEAVFRGNLAAWFNQPNMKNLAIDEANMTNFLDEQSKRRILTDFFNSDISSHIEKGVQEHIAVPLSNMMKYKNPITRDDNGKLIKLSKRDDFSNPDFRYKHGKSPIHINPANRGKFNALKKRTGKTTEQLTHSKNPLTRKRAIFAQNSKKFKH